MEGQTNENGIRIVPTFGKITVEKIEAAEYQKEGTLTAHLRQVVTIKSYYPSKKKDNEMEDSLFSNEEFGFEEQEFVRKDNRVAFMLVPIQINGADGNMRDITVEDVQKRVDSLGETAKCYRVMSNRPILTSGQVHAINTGMRTLDEIALKQVVKHGEESETPGELIPYEGKLQYRRVFFSEGVVDEDTGEIEAKADVELRGKVEEYIPESLAETVKAFATTEQEA